MPFFILVLFILLTMPSNVLACGNSRYFFGCAPDVFYDIPEDVVQIMAPLGCGHAVCPENEAMANTVISPPQPGQVKLPKAWANALKSAPSRTPKEGLSFPCPQPSPSDNYLCNLAQLYAEMHAQYINRYPIRNLFDGNSETVWVEGVYGNGTGNYFHLGSNAGPLTIVGVEVVNGYPKTTEIFLRNNRIKTLKLTFPTVKTLPALAKGMREEKQYSELYDAIKPTFRERIIRLEDTPDKQIIDVQPFATQELEVAILGTYRGTGKENDTALAELRFILSDGRRWPEAQPYWLEQVPGSHYFPSDNIITDVPLARATATLRVVNHDGDQLHVRRFPETGGDVDEPGEVEPSAHLISKQGSFLSGGLFADLTQTNITEKPLNTRLVASAKDSYRKYDGIFPIRFLDSGSVACIFNGRTKELQYYTIPDGTLIRHDKLSQNILQHLATAGKETMGAAGLESLRPGFVLFSHCVLK